jgi:hypothetical protein
MFLQNLHFWFCLRQGLTRSGKLPQCQQEASPTIISPFAVILVRP